MYKGQEWTPEESESKRAKESAKRSCLKVSQNLVSSKVRNAVEATSMDILACEAAKFVEGHQASSKHQDQKWEA